MRIKLFSLLLAATIGFADVVPAQPLPSGLPGAAKDTTLPALPAPSAPARDLFARHKEKLVQVRVVLSSAGEQSALGSGFLVRDDGADGVLLVTNYHVISQFAVNPEKFRIEIRQTSEQVANATLAAIDVRHDLAILRMDAGDAGNAKQLRPLPTFALREDMPRQGERIYALGNPLELGFLISEGVYNGLAESQIYDHMLFSGALNSGMSGGPAIDEAGRVAGINVSVRQGAQLLSFLVPVTHARTLAADITKSAPRREWRTEISRQLLAHQEFMIERFMASRKNIATDKSPTSGFASQMLGGRRVATLDGSLTRCWAGSNDGDKPRYHEESLQCALHSSVFVRGNLETGSLSVNHLLLRNEKLATPQFLALRGTNRFVLSLMRNIGGEHTREECRDDYFQAGAHVYSVTICMSAFRKFDGLYNFRVSAQQVDDARERLLSALSMEGVSFANGQRIARLFMEQMQ